MFDLSYFAKGTLGMKNERILRHLLEMIDLDSSEYVRLMVRLFLTLIKIISIYFMIKYIFEKSYRCHMLFLNASYNTHHRAPVVYNISGMGLTWFIFISHIIYAILHNIIIIQFQNLNL